MSCKYQGKQRGQSLRFSSGVPQVGEGMSQPTFSPSFDRSENLFDVLQSMGYRPRSRLKLRRYLEQVGLATIGDLLAIVSRDGVYADKKNGYTIPFYYNLPHFGGVGMGGVKMILNKLGFDWEAHTISVRHYPDSNARLYPLLGGEEQGLDFLVGGWGPIAHYPLESSMPGGGYLLQQASKYNLNTVGDLAKYVQHRFELRDGKYAIRTWTGAPAESVRLVQQILAEHGYCWWENVKFCDGYYLEASSLSQHSYSYHQGSRASSTVKPAPRSRRTFNETVSQDILRRKAEAAGAGRSLSAITVGGLGQAGIYSIDALKRMDKEKGRRYLYLLLNRQSGFGDEAWNVVCAMLDSNS